MLQNARVTAFTVSELLSENQQGGEKSILFASKRKVKSVRKLNVKYKNIKIK